MVIVERLFPSVPKPANHESRQLPIQLLVPLVQQIPPRHDDEHPQPTCDGIGGGNDSDSGLAGTGDGFNDPSATCLTPRIERFGLPVSRRGAIVVLE